MSANAMWCTMFSVHARLSSHSFRVWAAKNDPEP